MTEKTPPVEARLAIIAEEFHKFEGEGLKTDIAQGRLLREAREILKDEQGWCEYVKQDLRSNNTQADRLIARARAADWVPFNELLNLTRTAIDILAAKIVPDAGALKEAIERSKRGEQITEEFARQIADEHLEAAGRKRRKSRKKTAQPGQEITVADSPRAIACHLGNTYQPEVIYRVADAAANQSLRRQASRRNSVSLLDAMRWVMPALPNDTTIKAGVATSNVLFRGGFVSTYSGGMRARSPCAQDDTFMVHGKILEGWLELDKELDEEPQLRLEGGHVKYDIPDDDGDYWFTPIPIEGFCPKDKGLIDRYPNGERHALPLEFSLALSSLRRLPSPAPGKRVDNGVVLFGGGAVVLNLPIAACVRNVGVTLDDPIKVPRDAISFLMRQPSAPTEILVEPDIFWFRWTDGFHIAIHRAEISESAASNLDKVVGLLDRCDESAVKTRTERPAVFERTNGISSRSVHICPTGLRINPYYESKVDAVSQDPAPWQSQAERAIDLGAFPNLLTFKDGNVLGLIGLLDATNFEDDAAEG
jgi:hypothetical protein